MIVKFRQTFIKNLKKVNPKIQNKTYSRIELFKLSPYDIRLNNHALSGKFSGHRSINITGDYRAIFYEKNEIATFINLGTHSQLY